MKPPSLWPLALGLAFVLAGCNTQNAEPLPGKEQATATAERPAGPPSPQGIPPGHPTIAGGSTITGRISLAPGLAGKVPPEAVLFVIARRQGLRAPVAVVGLRGVSFPVPYTIGLQNMMSPSDRFEGEVEISARLDRDGKAGPPQPGDMEGVYPKNPVSMGAKDVDFMLDKLY